MSSTERAAKGAASLAGLDRGIDLLEVLAERGEVRLGDLPDRLGVSRATAFRLLRTLQRRGYVEHLPRSHSYRLGTSTVVLAARCHASAVLAATSTEMTKLHQAVQETVNLALFRGSGLVYASILEGPRALRMTGTVGEYVPPHATAIGKAILAHTDDDRRSDMLPDEPYPAFTPNTLTNRALLDAQLARVRESGWAVDEEEMDLGAACVAAEFRDPNDDVTGAISVSGPAVRLAPRIDELGSALRAAADRISTTLASQSRAG